MKVAIITSSFPYPPGEQFIETEIEFWGNTGFDEVYLLPTSSSGPERQVPKNILIDTALSRKPPMVLFAMRALLSRVFYRDILYLYSGKKISLGTVFSAWKSTTSFLKAKYLLGNWLQSKGPIDLIYTYWSTEYSYAASVVKETGLVRKAISRAHRFDLYEDRRRSGYMPLKRQFINSLDQLYVLSQEAELYTNITYGLEQSRISISPLGVFFPKILSKASSLQDLKILSVSFCVPVKRIDKIIQSIARFAILNPDLNIMWTHVGGGVLKEDLMEVARDIFKRLQNVSFNFLGHLSNNEVRAIYCNQEVDIFVNASESEGVPVSIMEAMSSGVPIIAPDVGGISELVGNDCGVLMSSNPDIDELCGAFSQLVVAAKSDSFRMRAREKVTMLHDANKNYPAFIESLEKLASKSFVDHKVTYK